jgi:ABC-type dipeptide/oligopeptide/nickel transport system permease component
VFRFVVRRLIWAVPTLLIVTFLVYVAIRIGTDPVASYLRSNQRASQAKIQEYIEKNGLYEGFGGYVKGYFQWLGGFLTGDWPNSIKGNREVWPTLKDAMANTLRLAGIAACVGILVGITFGVLAALKPGSLRDGGVNTTALVMLSIPPFISAILLQMLFGVYTQEWFPNATWLHLPVAGVYPAGQQGFNLVLMLKHLILPVTVVAIQTVAIYARYMRASLLETLNSDYLRTARAKGISERQVLVRHAMRNAMLPIVTLAAIDFGALFAGLIITERIFSYPGMGDFFLTAYENGDFPELMPWMVIVVVTVIMFNLLADLSYAVLDPRIRLD